MKAYEETVNPRKDGADSAYVRNWRGKPITHSGLTKICQKYGLGSTHRVRHGAAEEARKRKAAEKELAELNAGGKVVLTMVVLHEQAEAERLLQAGREAAKAEIAEHQGEEPKS